MFYTFPVRILVCLALGVIVTVLTACSEPHIAVVAKEKVVQTPPSWAKEAIWYQILIERFENGDPTNDPTISSINGAYPGFVPSNWTPTPWTQNWYKADPYFAHIHGKMDTKGVPLISFEAKTKLRRYGGDLQGVLNKLDYLADLGVNAIYLNPINDAPSAQKYDARNWRHVDVNFGPDPIGDKQIISDEDPADPSTWQFTSADKLFLKLIAQAKKRGIRIILDYAFNHTGHTFWAFKDVLKHQQASPYAHWYNVEQFDDPKTANNEFKYRGSLGVLELPEIQENAFSDKSTLINDGVSPYSLSEHVFAITQRWLDPNGDGNTQDGVDGFRLNAATKVPLSFWQDYRKLVKTMNPEAYLIAEVLWGKSANNVLKPAKVLQGDMFDAVVNYRWFRAAQDFFSTPPSKIKPSEFAKQLSAIGDDLLPQSNYAMMNMSASHDSQRLLSSMSKRNKYTPTMKGSKNSQNKAKTPNNNALSKAKLLLAHQYTYIGAPQIWAGDEMGMWGGDNENNRKPLMWPELNFEDETSHPLSIRKTTKKVAFDASLFVYYQSLVRLRKTFAVFSNGDIRFSLADDKKSLFGYERSNASGEKALVVFNMKNKAQSVILPNHIINSQEWLMWDSEQASLYANVPSETLVIAPFSAIVIIIQ